MTAPIVRCFNGITSAEQARVGGTSFAPDCNGAVSNSYFVEFINNAFSVYDKETGALVGNRVHGHRRVADGGARHPGELDGSSVYFRKVAILTHAGIRRRRNERNTRWGRRY